MKHKIYTFKQTIQYLKEKTSQINDLLDKGCVEEARKVKIQVSMDMIGKVCTIDWTEKQKEEYNPVWEQYKVAKERLSK